ncbi:efflux RND transporter periplasmic adaptor subunit [Capnocytophaga gingivalis]|jgi:efflux transporter, RND family, MFP subunit|uniref:efflux RND transporter periplasmic adaptor subunit n=1 Tax=Capnocytophaga gingivalis TaxID=1017 RepID=UPI0028E85B83|nr:efflux RND transporter periplasmic adaptor subunit [Capnocytophaga gingivalis]MEB3014606.1 efflux RND transporter periplasmic adaptor subunit [Capnocytophaga gingivalis]
MKKYSIKIAFILITLFTLSACNNNTSTADHQEVEEEHHHEEENTTTLTQTQIKTVDIRLGHIEQKALTATLKANGVLSVPADHQAKVSTIYTGIIQSVKVEIGAYVHKGQVIATISNPDFLQQQQRLLTVNSQIELAQQELDRQQILYEGNAGTGKNLQAATTQLRTLRTEKAALEEQIRLMGLNPKTLTNEGMQSTLAVVAPISGNISAVYTNNGAYVDASTPIVEIIDNSSLHLHLQVYERDLPYIKVGQQVHFNPTNNTSGEYDAQVYNIAASFENESKSIIVHCHVEGDKQGLISGMNVTGVISLDKETAPAVPNDAIVEDSGKSYIFVVTHTDNKETTFEKIEVAKGASESGYTAIAPVKPIASEQTIATKGAFFINATLVNSGEHEH